MDSAAKNGYSFLGVLIAGHAPNQFCPAMWKETHHLIRIWFAGTNVETDFEITIYFISIKEQKEENTDYQYTQEITPS